MVNVATAEERVDQELAELMAQEEEQSSEYELGEFYNYDNQMSIPEKNGNRAVKCLYKISSVSGERVRPNQFVLIPSDHLTQSTILDSIESFLPYFLSYLQEIEDGIIKESHRKGQTNVHIPGLSLEKLLLALEEKELGNRLNKDKIEAWFDSEVMELLIVAFAEKIGVENNIPTTDQQKKLTMICEAYKQKFVSLAGGKTIIKGK